MAFVQLLARQCRPEIGVALADDRQGAQRQARSVARVQSSRRHKARQTDACPGAAEQARDRPEIRRSERTVLEDTTRFYPIAGDVFVLRYDEVKTLNVTYLSREPQR